MNLCGVLALLLLQSVSAAPVFLQRGSPLPGNVPFSAAVRQGDVLYLSGQLGTLAGTRTLAPGGIQAEARQAIFNIQSILGANGLGLKDVIRCTVMLADIGDWAAFNDVWVSMFSEPYPARSAFATSGLALGGRVEVECTAAAAQ
jgi:reactive intermediate/imine deaminase